MSVCRGTKRSGEPCTAPATGTNGYCWAHSPEHAAERRRIARMGGRSKGSASNREVEGLKAEVRTVIERVDGGCLDRNDAGVMLQGYRILKDLIELQRRVKETEDLLVRIEALERIREREKGARNKWRRA